MMLYSLAVTAVLVCVLRGFLPEKAQKWLSPLKCALIVLVLQIPLLDTAVLALLGWISLGMVGFGLVQLLNEHFHVRLPRVSMEAGCLLGLGLSAGIVVLARLGKVFEASQPHTSLYYSEAVSEALAPLPGWTLLSYSAYWQGDVVRPLIFAGMIILILAGLFIRFLRKGRKSIAMLAASAVLGVFCAAAALTPFVNGGCLMLREADAESVEATGVLESVRLDVHGGHNYLSLYGNDPGHIVTISGEEYRCLSDVMGYESNYEVEFTYLPESRIILYIGGPEIESAGEE